MSSLRILCRNTPQRAIALATSEYALVFQYGSVEQFTGARSAASDAPRCVVEFTHSSTLNPNDYRPLGYGYGTLGLITLDGKIFVCIVTGYSQAATVRPGETISRINSVGFCTSSYFVCINYSDREKFALATKAMTMGLTTALRRNLKRMT